FLSFFKYIPRCYFPPFYPPSPTRHFLLIQFKIPLSFSLSFLLSPLFFSPFIISSTHTPKKATQYPPSSFSHEVHFRPHHCRPVRRPCRYPAHRHGHSRRRRRVQPSLGKENPRAVQEQDRCLRLQRSLCRHRLRWQGETHRWTLEEL
ncbi:hypothetical protein F5H01DRAFT_383965, partial [Linnemannia elongata]